MAEARLHVQSQVTDFTGVAIKHDKIEPDNGFRVEVWRPAE